MNLGCRHCRRKRKSLLRPRVSSGLRRGRNREVSVKSPVKKSRLASDLGVKIRAGRKDVESRRAAKASAAKVRRAVAKSDLPAIEKKKAVLSAAAGGVVVEVGADADVMNATASEAATIKLEMTAMKAGRSVSSITRVPKSAKYVQIGKSNRSRQKDRSGQLALTDKNDRSGRSDLRAEMSARSAPHGSGRKNLIAQANARTHRSRFEKSRRSRPR